MKNYPLYKMPQHRDLKSLIGFRAENDGDKVAFRFLRKKEVVEKTYSDFKSDVEAFGTYLYSLGLIDKHIALIGENSYEWIVAYFAAVCGGNVIVPIDKELSNEDIKDIIIRSESTALVYSNLYSDIADENSNLICLNMKIFDKYIQKGKDLVKSGNIDYINYKVENRKLSTIIFTSGTTGKPKGVMLCQKGITASAIAASENTKLHYSNLTVLPLHHAFAFTACVVAAIVQNVTCFINSSLKNLMRDMDIAKPQHVLVVPMMIDAFYKKINDGIKESGKENAIKLLISLNRALMNVGIDIRHILFKQIRKSFGGNLEMIVTGGAPANSESLNGMRDLGFTVVNGYGITECSPIVAVERNKFYRLGSVGQVVPKCDVKIIDGEVCVSGEIVMLGYYKDEQAAKDAFNGEWFKTGDLGYLDDDGFLFITGRKKNLIILSNGKNVSPEELEEKIQNIEHVNEVIVYAENDLITAEIFAENTEGIEHAVEELNKDLPIYKQIQKVKFRDKEFEKTTTKKIKRTK